MVAGGPKPPLSALGLPRDRCAQAWLFCPCAGRPAPEAVVLRQEDAGPCTGLGF